MTKVVFTREVGDRQYTVEGEMLPSGSALFTFSPALPGRSAVISVNEELVQDVVRTMALGIEYDLELDAVVMVLHLVRPNQIVDTKDEPGFKTAVEVVPAKVVLEMLLDPLMESCPTCGAMPFGDDVTGPDDGNKGGSDKSYLN
jgi:hypothetical protein